MAFGLGIGGSWEVVLFDLAGCGGYREVEDFIVVLFASGAGARC